MERSLAGVAVGAGGWVGTGLGVSVGVPVAVLVLLRMPGPPGRQNVALFEAPVLDEVVEGSDIWCDRLGVRGLPVAGSGNRGSKEGEQDRPNRGIESSHGSLRHTVRPACVPTW